MIGITYIFLHSVLIKRSISAEMSRQIIEI